MNVIENETFLCKKDFCNFFTKGEVYKGLKDGRIECNKNPGLYYVRHQSFPASEYHLLDYLEPMENKTEKPIAVKITSKEEFKAVSEFMIKNGMNPYGEGKYHKDYPHLSYEDNWSQCDIGAGYDIISFNAFSKLTGVKVDETKSLVIFDEMGGSAKITDKYIEFAGDIGVQFAITHNEFKKLHTAFHSLTH